MVKCVWFCCVVIGYDRTATCEHSLRLYSTVMHCERCNVYTSHCCISYNAIHKTVVYYRIWVSMAGHRQLSIAGRTRQILRGWVTMSMATWHHTVVVASIVNLDSVPPVQLRMCSVTQHLKI